MSRALLIVSNPLYPWSSFSGPLFLYLSDPPARPLSLHLFLGLPLIFLYPGVFHTILTVLSSVILSTVTFLLLLSSLSVDFGKTRRSLRLFFSYIRFQSFPPLISFEAVSFLTVSLFPPSPGSIPMSRIHIMPSVLLRFRSI